jgi:hypothetical protein
LPCDCSLSVRLPPGAVTLFVCNIGANVKSWARCRYPLSILRRYVQMQRNRVSPALNHSPSIEKINAAAPDIAFWDAARA